MNSKSPTSKSGKNSFANLVAVNNSKAAFVPPILRDVGKLAAGVASVNTSTGSATGNPRNKCALQPGHSLMDWIRLGASGKDLTGVGHQAGRLSVTLPELSKHNREEDAWLAIRGRVYNVTAYLPFHPGGPEELMKGAGRDATSLFDQIHPWVNYEQILQKCLIGKLVHIDPSINTEALFLGDDNIPASSEKTSTTPSVAITSTQNEAARPSNNTQAAPASPTLVKEQKKESPQRQDPPADKTPVETPVVLPRFDWIQKLEHIAVIFYTKALANPLVEVQTVEKTVIINITYHGRTYVNELVFHRDVEWPCDIKVIRETGKVELGFKKTFSGIWENYGVLTQKSKTTGSISSTNKQSYVVTNKRQINHNIYLLELNRTDNSKIVVPIGHHIRIFGDISGTEVSRSYTPVPRGVFSKLGPEFITTDSICLLVKRYSNGTLSKYVCDALKGDVLDISKPLSGGFSLSELDKKDIHLMLAAGTGITPMLSILTFLLDKRVKKSKSIRLLFWNKSIRDIPLKTQFDDLSTSDPRFKVTHILSQPDDSWNGATGHIKQDIIEETISDQLHNTVYVKRDFYVMVCGPPIFVDIANTILLNAEFKSEQIFLFKG